MEVIKLNLIPTGALPVVHASQYDDGRIFRADLYDGAEVYHLDGTETISCELKKPDGNIVTLAVTNTSESFIEIQTTEQTCAVAGESLAEVKIEKGDDKIGSLNFILSVERSPIEGGISSASEINNLWTQVDGMVADALATQYDSANVVFDNLPTEGHGIPYTVTSEGIGNAIDNALDMTAEASGAIATFESDYALPLRDLEIEINAVQESGTPTPSSPKAIIGFTGANIHVADDENPHVIDNVTAITWQDEAGTVYGGSLDVTSGVLTVTWHAIDLGSLTWTYDAGSVPSNPYFFCQRDIVKVSTQNLLCSIYQLANVGVSSMPNYSMKSNNKGQVLVVNHDYSDENTFKTAMSGVLLVCEKLTPVTYQLTPTQISAIVGTNNVFTDTNGDTSLEYYTKRGEQTVRIAEGVAVDVINNKNIDTLATTDKTIIGGINEVNGNKPTNTADSPFLKVKTTANITKSINANGYASILGSDIDLAEAGYTPIGIVSMYNTQSAGCFFGSIDCRIVTGSSAFCVVKNTSASNITATMNFTILFMRNSN